MDRDNHKQVELPTQEEFQALVKQANAGDQAAIAALRQVLDAEPQIARKIGDLFEHAKEALIGLIAEDNSLLAESLRREAAAMETELAGKRPPLLERMAVRRVVLNWLQLLHFDVTDPDAKGKMLARKNAAERHWTQALKTLELVRSKLALKPMSKPKRKKQSKARSDKRPERKASGVPVNRIRDFVGAN